MVTLYAAKARAKEFVEHPAEMNAPPGLAYAGPDQERCWTCLHYSYKNYGSDDSNEGKCFAFKVVGKTHVTHALNWCPEYQLDITPTDIDDVEVDITFPDLSMPSPETVLYETLHQDGGKTIHSTNGVKVINHEGVVVMKLGAWGYPKMHPKPELKSLFGYETTYDVLSKTYVVRHWDPKIAPLYVAQCLLEDTSMNHVADMVAEWSNKATVMLQSLATDPESP